MKSSQLEKSDVTEPATQEFLQAAGEGLADDISTETQVEEQQQPLEKQGEVQSSEEVKVESWKDDKLNEEALMDIEVKSGEDVDNGNEQFSAIPELQSVPSLSGTPVEANDFYDIQSQPADRRIDPEMDAPMKDVEMDNKALVEKVTLQDQQLENGNMVDGHALDANAETSTKEKDKAILPVSEELRLAEQNKGLDGDKQLIEENKKLREMTNKLLEAGNQQLNVISDLTGRVKDLEKKLARKRRLRTKRYRPATSCMKSSNDLSQVKSVRVAM
ncbi:hypothetical protein L6164_021183 [Bauhinia variegata]|uniref:Uncharacterized protein n=1 Tax=Bauhinia variegata TaxID=167791 RepID=A0ACB9MY72_BAUVA|nr:hypothetical protein L6164_021183 [Bauhinia variegata]